MFWLVCIVLRMFVIVFGVWFSLCMVVNQFFPSFFPIIMLGIVKLAGVCEFGLNGNVVNPIRPLPAVFMLSLMVAFAHIFCQMFSVLSIWLLCFFS